MPYKDQQKQREYQRNKAKAKRERFSAIKCAAKARPCADCGVQYPCHVMQFDHLRDKEFGLAGAALISVSEDQLLNEIAKCDVVCANCHAERTYQRACGKGAGQSLQD
jgi:hypothetical protein